MRLLLRHFASSVGASILVAVIVLVVTAVVALVPRAVSVMTTAELRHQLDSVADEVRDPVAETVGGIPTFEEDADPYSQMDDALAGIRDSAPDRLRSLLGEPDYYSRTEALPTPDATPDRDAPLTLTRVAFDPRIESRVTLVQGDFPGVWDGDRPFGIILSEKSAEQERWEVGEVRTLQSGVELVLSGIFAPLAPDDRYWKHAESVLVPQLLDDGNSTPKVTATGYANPLSVGLFGGNSSRITVWYPLDADGLDFTDAAAVAPELRTFTTTPFSLPLPELGLPQSLRFESGTVPVLDAVLSRAATTVAVLAMIASGPLGVVLAVFALGASSVVERRRPAIALASARGASGLQVRGALALEGLALGVLPAALGIGLSLLLPARVGPEAFLAPVLLGLAPAVLFAVSASPRGLRSTRADLGSARAGRVRWIVEALVVLLAATAVVLLLRRGLATSAASVGVDPLLAATPLLLSLAACVIVLRLYPVPLVALSRALRRRSGLAGFLGATRSVRDRSLALGAVLALVVGMSVSVFSSVLLTTVDRGVAAGAASTVGADLRAEGPVFASETVEAVSGLPGVDAAVGIDVAVPAALRVDKVRTTVNLFVVDTGSLAGIRALPSGLDELDGSSIPIVVSSDLADEIAAGAELLLEGKEVTIAGVEDRTTGFGETASWVILDDVFAEEVTGNGALPRLLLVDTAPTADTTVLSADLVELGGPTTTVTSIAQAEAEARSAPTTAGLRVALIVSIVAIALLAALAVIMSSAIGAESRNRMLALLHTLGLSSRQTSALVAWELAPLALVAVVAGTALGLALPWVVLAGVDLRPFTGGRSQPDIAADPLLLTAVLGGVALTVVAAGIVSIIVARRRDPASTLRMGAE